MANVGKMTKCVSSRLNETQQEIQRCDDVGGGLAVRRQGIKAAKYPAKGESRVKFPIFTPRFELHPDMRVFTIGSCFAPYRAQVEGFSIANLRFSAPYSETPIHQTHSLNEVQPRNNPKNRVCAVRNLVA